MMKEVTSVELPGIQKLRSGKVREVFDLGTDLLFVATDRISAFDCILPDPIPGKGAFLNTISAFWFKKFHQVPNHFVTADFDKFPEPLQPYEELLRDRSMIVRRAEPLPVECVVRLPGGFGMERIQGHRHRLWNQTAGRPGTGVATSKADFFSGNKSCNRARSEHLLGGMLRHFGRRESGHRSRLESCSV